VPSDEHAVLGGDPGDDVSGGGVRSMTLRGFGAEGPPCCLDKSLCGRRLCGPGCYLLIFVPPEIHSDLLCGCWCVQNTCWLVPKVSV
jgi:hypothetical protein